MVGVSWAKSAKGLLRKIFGITGTSHLWQDILLAAEPVVLKH